MPWQLTFGRGPTLTLAWKVRQGPHGGEEERKIAPYWHQNYYFDCQDLSDIEVASCRSGVEFRDKKSKKKKKKGHISACNKKLCAG